MGQYLDHNYTDHGTLYIVLDVVGKRTENVIEIRAYIKGRSLLGLKPVDIHRVVCEKDARYTVMQLARITQTCL